MNGRTTAIGMKDTQETDVEIKGTAAAQTDHTLVRAVETPMAPTDDVHGTGQAPTAVALAGIEGQGMITDVIVVIEENEMEATAVAAEATVDPAIDTKTTVEMDRPTGRDAMIRIVVAVDMVVTIGSTEIAKTDVTVAKMAVRTADGIIVRTDVETVAKTVAKTVEGKEIATATKLEKQAATAFAQASQMLVSTRIQNSKNFEPKRRRGKERKSLPAPTTKSEKTSSRLCHGACRGRRRNKTRPHQA